VGPRVEVEEIDSKLRPFGVVADYCKSIFKVLHQGRVLDHVEREVEKFEDVEVVVAVEIECALPVGVIIGRDEGDRVGAAHLCLCECRVCEACAYVRVE